MNKKQVLFVCIHNSARSQMAEAFLNKLGVDTYNAQSAGIEPGSLNPVVVEAMLEIGIDISKNETKELERLIHPDQHFDFVITVCDEASAERCPVFPGKVNRLHWPFADPSGFQGTLDEKLEKTRGVRDSIKKRVVEFIRSGN